jgi:hypothetical protein
VGVGVLVKVDEGDGVAVGVPVAVYVAVLVRVKVGVDPDVLVNVGLTAPHTMFTDALSATAASLSPFINAILFAAHGQVLPAVTQYFTVPHWFICMLPTFQEIVRLAGLYEPAGMVDTNPPQLTHAGNESVMTTPETSRPGMGPFPNTLRHTYPSHSSIKIFCMLVAVVSQAFLFTLFTATEVPSPLVQSGLMGNIILSGPPTTVALVCCDQSSVQSWGW